MTTLEKIRAEIRKVIDKERDFSSENAKAQALALMWCLELIDKYAEQAEIQADYDRQKASGMTDEEWEYGKSEPTDEWQNGYDMAWEEAEVFYEKQEPTSPCDLCRFNPPSSADGKPCTMCPAEKGGECKKAKQEPSEDMTIAYLMGYYADKEPCTDSVSRQAVLNEFYDMENLYNRIKQLPPVRPQEPCEDAVDRRAVLDYLKNNVDDFPDYHEAIEKILELPSVQPSRKGHWILVSERLPEDGENVIFSTKTDRVFEGRFFNDNTEQQWYAFRDETFAWNNVVNAWMPLPEPYKADMRGAE